METTSGVHRDGPRPDPAPESSIGRRLFNVKCQCLCLYVNEGGVIGNHPGFGALVGKTKSTSVVKL